MANRGCLSGIRPTRRGATRALSALVAVGLVTVLLAPAASAKKKTTTTTSSSTTTTTVPAAWDPRLQPIADKVAELRGLAFMHPVAAEFLDDAAFEAQITEEMGKLSKQDQAELARAEAQLKAIGLIAADVDVREEVEKLQASGVAAYYNPKTQRITVKGTNLDDVATRVTVAHELTHALQDQHFDLDRLQKTAEKRSGSTALRSVAEGDAERIQHDYVDTLSQEEQDTYETRSTELAHQAFTEMKEQGVPGALSFGFGAPYALGSSMVDALVVREQAGAVDGLFTNPPVADAVFVTPWNLLDHRTFQTVETPTLAKGERRSGTAEQFGSLALFQMLASRIDNATALTAADAWDGDSMITYARKGQTCLRATFAGKGPEGTTAITDALNQWAAQMPVGSTTVNGTPDRVTLTACDAGASTAAAPNNPDSSMAFLASRDGLFVGSIEAGDSNQVAICTADGLVRDPAFAPVLDAAGNDPTATPDPGLVAQVGSRLRDIRIQCQQA